MSAKSYVVNTFAYIWQQPIHDCVRHLAENGHSQLEVLLTAPHCWPSDFDRSSRLSLVRLLERLGSRIVSLNLGGFDNNLVSPAQNVRDLARQTLEQVIDLAADVGARFVVMSPGVARPLLPPPRSWLLTWFRLAMEALTRHAQRRNVQLLLENIPFSFLPRAQDLIEAVNELPGECVGIVYDVANAVYVREDPVANVTRLAPRLRLVHVSDTGLDTWKHAPVGTGVVPFARFGAALRDQGYAGPVVLEIISGDPDRDIRNSIAALGQLGW